MQYLAKKAIAVGAGTDKVKLIKQIIDLWNGVPESMSDDTPYFNNNNNNNNNHSHNNNNNNNDSSQRALPSIKQLCQQFTEWFYTSWNEISTFKPDHFFPDCQLTLVHENNRQVAGAYFVCEILRTYVGSQELRFCPNTNSNKVEESKHGLVLIQIHGTIHQRGSCIGIFDQSFGLARDPSHGNNYLIKFCFLNLQTQQAKNQLLSANQPTPTYLVDIMQNYDQTYQRQVDSTDYIIEDPDDDEFDA